MSISSILPQMYALLSQFTTMANADGKISDLEQKIISIITNLCNHLESIQHGGLSISNVDQMMDKLNSLSTLMNGIPGASISGPLNGIISDLKEIKEDLIDEQAKGQGISLTSLERQTIDTPLDEVSDVDGIGSISKDLEIQKGLLHHDKKHREKFEDVTQRIAEVAAAFVGNYIGTQIENIDFLNPEKDDVNKRVTGIDSANSSNQFANLNTNQFQNLFV